MSAVEEKTLIVTLLFALFGFPVSVFFSAFFFHYLRPHVSAPGDALSLIKENGYHFLILIAVEVKVH